MRSWGKQKRVDQEFNGDDFKENKPYPTFSRKLKVLSEGVSDVIVLRLFSFGCGYWLSTTTLLMLNWCNYITSYCHSHTCKHRVLCYHLVTSINIHKRKHATIGWLWLHIDFHFFVIGVAIGSLKPHSFPLRLYP